MYVKKREDNITSGVLKIEEQRKDKDVFIWGKNQSKLE